jgi:hypothetical protein
VLTCRDVTSSAVTQSERPGFDFWQECSAFVHVVPGVPSASPFSVDVTSACIFNIVQSISLHGVVLGHRGSFSFPQIAEF